MRDLLKLVVEKRDFFFKRTAALIFVYFSFLSASAKFRGIRRKLTVKMDRSAQDKREETQPSHEER